MVALAGTINVVANWDKIDNFWEGLGYFASGGVQGGLATLGPVGAIAGGFLSSAFNTALDGGSFDDMLKNGFVGGVASFAGGVAGKWAGKYLGNLVINGLKIASPILKGAVGGFFGGSLGGYASGFVGGFMQTGSLSQAHHIGVGGLKMGAGVGTVSGTVGAYKWARDNKIDPWTGKDLMKSLPNYNSASNINSGKYPEGYINTKKIEGTGMPNLQVEYTSPNGKPISKAFYNQNGLLEFQIDYRPHNMGYVHGHEFSIPGYIPSGHTPQNHIPFMGIPIKYFKR